MVGGQINPVISATIISKCDSTTFAYETGSEVSRTEQIATCQPVIQYFSTGINFRISFLKLENSLKTDKPTTVVLSNLPRPPQGVLFSLRGEVETLVTGDEAQGDHAERERREGRFLLNFSPSFTRIFSSTERRVGTRQILNYFDNSDSISLNGSSAFITSSILGLEIGSFSIHHSISTPNSLFVLRLTFSAWSSSFSKTSHSPVHISQKRTPKL